MVTGDVALKGKLLYRRALAFRGLRRVDKAMEDLADPSLKEDKVRCARVCVCVRGAGVIATVGWTVQ
jgi:hypothetical protein